MQEKPHQENNKKKFQFVDILSTNMPFWNQKFQYLGYAIGSMKIMFFPTMQSVCQKCWWNFEKAHHAAGHHYY